MNEIVRRTYCTIAAIGQSPRLRGGCDTWLCRWADVSHYVSEYLDNIEDENSATLSFTLHSWTDEEFERHCEENSIEPF